MDGNAHDLLQGVAQVRARVRRDRRFSSVPLLVFAGLSLAGAPFAVPDTFDGAGRWFWAVAAPAGFLLVAWWFGRLRSRIGVDAGPGVPAALALAAVTLLLNAFPPAAFLLIYAAALAGVGLIVAGLVRRDVRVGLWGVAVLVLVPFAAPLVLVTALSSEVTVGLALLALGICLRGPVLIAGAVAFTAVAALNGFLVLGNALAHLGVPEGAAQVVVAVLPALTLLAAGLAARRREAAAG